MRTFEAFGKYSLLEKLATGGMAEVFLARGSGAGGIGKFFAIKRILPQFADSPEFIDMFKDEAKIAINLSHNNIVSIHEFGVEKGQFFIVMDYVEGRNLRQILNKMKKSGLQFTVEQIIYIFKEVAAGLDHAHRCIDGTTGKPLNITHRDMSPQNVMVSFEGEVKIVDFGIAKAESQLETTRAGTLKGKFGYMSPEQAEGQSVDLRTDIFSLGIVLWELLANDRLFAANNEINTLRKIRDCQIPSLRKVNPNIHTELERIVQKALARDKNLRYQTGAALHRDLNRFLNRQYPDFSSQDFAVFIKSVFADEILSLRKRLVEYARVNLLNSVGQGSLEDRTAITRSDSVSRSPADLAGTNSEITTLTPPPHGSELRIQEITPTPALGAPKLIPTGIPSAVLDEQAILAELERKNAKGRRATESTQDNPSPTLTDRIRSRSNSHSRAFARARRTISTRIATFTVFSLLCLSVYAYLVKYFTPIMSVVIQSTDPYLHSLHSALGVEPQSTAPSVPEDLREPAAPPDGVDYETADSPSPTPALDPIQVAAEPVPEPTDLGPPTAMITVTSNPSGANIWLDGKNTGMVTPSRVEVSTRKKFSLSIRKRGYANYVMRDTSKDKVGTRISANMIKQRVAFVDVEVFPPLDAILFVNGKQIKARLPIRDLEIQANTPVKIRAEARTGNGFDEVIVNLPVDKRQSLQLNPRKSPRLPSNSNSNSN